MSRRASVQLPPSARWPSRSPTSCDRCATRSCSRRAASSPRADHPHDVRAQSSAASRPRRSSNGSANRRRWSRPADPRAGRRDGARGRGRHGVRPPPEPDHDERRRDVRSGVRPFGAHRLGRGPRRRAATTATAAPTRVSSRTRAGRGCARRIPARPGSAWRRSRPRYDPDNVFRLNQNVPPR